MNEKFNFLFSPVFWQLFLVGVNAGLITYQQTHDLITSISTAIITWLGGSVGVNTLNKRGEKAVEVANIEAKVMVDMAKEGEIIS